MAPHDEDDRRVRVRCGRHHSVRGAVHWPCGRQRHDGVRRSVRSGDGLLSRQGRRSRTPPTSRVEYRRSYKVVTVKEAYAGGPAERYVLVQCGAPRAGAHRRARRRAGRAGADHLAVRRFDHAPLTARRSRPDGRAHGRRAARRRHGRRKPRRASRPARSSSSRRSGRQIDVERVVAAQAVAVDGRRSSTSGATA